MLQEYDHKAKALHEYSAGARSWMAPMIGAGTFMTPYPNQMVMEEGDKGAWMFSVEQEIPNPAKLTANQNYLESRNIAWVTQWNIRAMNPGRDQNLFQMSIDYHAGTNYGYEVNYMLFNYLVYFQQKNRIRLGGGFVPQL